MDTEIKRGKIFFFVLLLRRSSTIVFCMREQSRYARNLLYSVLARDEGEGDVYKLGEQIKNPHKIELAARCAGVGVCAVLV